MENRIIVKDIALSVLTTHEQIECIDELKSILSGEDKNYKYFVSTPYGIRFRPTCEIVMQSRSEDFLINEELKKIERISDFDCNNQNVMDEFLENLDKIRKGDYNENVLSLLKEFNNRTAYAGSVLRDFNSRYNTIRNHNM